MNKDNAKDFLPLVQALVAGKTIQCKVYQHNGSSVWMNRDQIMFGDVPANYRIKPEPVTAKLYVATWWPLDNNFPCNRLSSSKEDLINDHGGEPSFTIHPITITKPE